jgi:hypothetical protein
MYAIELLPMQRFLPLICALAAACAAPLPPPEIIEGEKPYRAEEVRIQTEEVTLAATLLTPVTETPTPVAIIIPGSGAASRNGSWHIYRHIGEYLVQRGIAVLLYDKRGVGGSTGNRRLGSGVGSR